MSLQSNLKQKSAKAADSQHEHFLFRTRRNELRKDAR